MSQDYNNDLFISYTHRGAVHKWVKFFYELLEDWLPYYLPYQPKIFIDWQIETGTHWPSKLQRELKMSRCLLSVWSPVYFASSWCLAEFQSFRARENILGLRTVQHPSGLIYAVLFASPQYLPSKVKTIQYNDLSEWAVTSPAFKESSAHMEFEKQVKNLCAELAKMILAAPDWRDDWPIKTPKPTPNPPFNKPRLS